MNEFMKWCRLKKSASTHQVYMPESKRNTFILEAGPLHLASFELFIKFICSLGTRAIRTMMGTNTRLVKCHELRNNLE